VKLGYHLAHYPLPRCSHIFLFTCSSPRGHQATPSFPPLLSTSKVLVNSSRLSLASSSQITLGTKCGKSCVQYIIHPQPVGYHASFVTTTMVSFKHN